MKYQVEVTDTFGGQANYSWVNRVIIDVEDGTTERALIRIAKAKVGWNGLKCDRSQSGETITLTPRRLCQVCFIYPVEA